MKPTEYIDRVLSEGKSSSHQKEIDEEFRAQIEKKKFAPITASVWNTALYEGLDEEWGVEKKDLEYMVLTIPKEDKEGLKKFSEPIIEKYNSFDIWLKNNFKNHIDFIDYDNGEIKIIRRIL